MDRNDKEIIESPDRWPQYPFLTVKREGWIDDNFANPKNLGVLHVSDPTVVIRINMYMIPQLSDEDLAKRCVDYSSIEELLADGWIVD